MKAAPPDSLEGSWFLSRRCSHSDVTHVSDIIAYCTIEATMLYASYSTIGFHIMSVGLEG